MCLSGESYMIFGKKYKDKNVHITMYAEDWVV